MTKRSAAVYVDGFNLYNGCLKHQPALRWLDLVALADDLLRSHHVKVVNYYTARVQDRPDDPDQSQRQDRFLRALAARNPGRVDVKLGTFSTHKRMMPLVKPLEDGTRFVRVYRTEEKGSDVNLGAQLVWDACHRAYDLACVVSNDSDLQTPVDMALSLGLDVVTVNPHFHADQPQSLIGNGTRKLTLGRLGRNLLPNPVVAADGTEFWCPRKWGP